MTDGSNDNGGYVGLKKWWQFPPTDPFNEPARRHDDAYEGKTGLTQDEADRLFLAESLWIANDSLYLRARAYFFYGWIRFAKFAGMSTWKGRSDADG